MSRTELPNSTGGFSGTMTEYDILGQAWRSTVPTEINSSWQPSGDDYRGLDSNQQPVWLWTSQEFDWKGRVTKEINTDNTFKTITYNGCGCAGGQVTTIEGELVPRDDIPTQNARRTQKIYSDILGRTFKTETMKWDGISVYSTNLNTFNGRDQALSVVQQDNSVNPVVSQETTTTYDGFGRTKTRHVPQQDIGTNTVYNYLLDGRIQNVSDARGVIENYAYLPNTGLNAGLLSQLSYTVPSNSNIPITPTVNHTYNNLGMRISMTDGLGTQYYVYNSLGQMTSETRQFTDVLPNAPWVNGIQAFKLEYGYSLTGQVISLKDPYGEQINYGFDKVGRLNNVSGTEFGGVTNYANNPQYRAFGALKHLEFGNNNAQMNQTFNNRLQTTNYEVTKEVSSITRDVVKQQYQYNIDGSLKSSLNGVNSSFDREFAYDFVGRLSQENTTGAFISQQGDYTTPYQEKYFYNHVGVMTARKGKAWEGMLNEVNLNYNFDANTNLQRYSYVNNRQQNPYFVYNQEGNLLTGDLQTNIYAANGQLNKTSNASNSTEPKIDGNGLEAKRITMTNSNQTWTTKTKYFIGSSILGRVISEVSQTGAKYISYVYAGGELIARQEVRANGTQLVSWKHTDVSGNSERWTGVNTISSGSRNPDFSELNTQGMSIPLTPTLDILYNVEPPLLTHQSASQTILGGGCLLDGMAVSCSLANSALENDSAYQAVSVTGSYTRKDKATGQIISRGTFTVNSGAGIGMMAASALGPMGSISGSVTHTAEQQNNITSQFGNWRNYFSAIFNPGQASRVASAEGGYVDDSTLLGSGGDSAKAFVNVGIGNSATLVEGGDEVYTEARQKCDRMLSGIFGEKDSVATGSGFEPTNLVHNAVVSDNGALKITSNLGGLYRTDGHLDNALHLYYGNKDGKLIGQSGGDLFVPQGGKYIGINPLVGKNQASYLFFYKTLGSLKNVFLVTSHVKNFIEPKGITTEKTKIGEIGGDGGSNPETNNERRALQGDYTHSHLSIFGQIFVKQRNSKKLKSHPGLPRYSFYGTFCK